MARLSAAYKAAHADTSTVRPAPTTVPVSPGGQSNGQRQSQRCVMLAGLCGMPVAIALRVIDEPMIHYSRPHARIRTIHGCLQARGSISPFPIS